MIDWTDEEWSEYIKEVNAAYWEEEEEIRLGIHPSQRALLGKAGDDMWHIMAMCG